MADEKHRTPKWLDRLTKFNAVATAIAAVVGIPALFNYVVPRPSVEVRVMDSSEWELAFINTGNRPLVIDDDATLVGSVDGGPASRVGRFVTGGNPFVLTPNAAVTYSMVSYGSDAGTMPERDCRIRYRWTTFGGGWVYDEVPLEC